MRIVSAVVARIAFMAVFAFGQLAEPADKPQPSDQDVVAVVGARVAKVFARFGAPEDITPADASSDEPKICLDYGGFGFLVVDKSVRTCLFWPAWTGSACGIKLGESADAAVKKLGKPDLMKKDDDGKQRMYWSFKANDEVMQMQASFDKNQKCTRVCLNVQ